MTSASVLSNGAGCVDVKRLEDGALTRARKDAGLCAWPGCAAWPSTVIRTGEWGPIVALCREHTEEYRGTPYPALIRMEWKRTYTRMPVAQPVRSKPDAKARSRFVEPEGDAA